MSPLLWLRHWRGGIMGALLLVIAVLWIGMDVVQRQNVKLKASLRDATELIETERAAVRAKTAIVRAEDAAHAATVERDQIQASQEVSDDYQKQLAALRARYDALRLRRPSTADPGGSGASAMPGVSDTPASADGATGAGGLPDPDRLIASEQALRLKALQDWVRAQFNVGR